MKNSFNNLVGAMLFGVWQKSLLWLLCVVVGNGQVPALAQNFRPTGSMVLPPSAVQALEMARAEHTATLLPNGQVLVTGGKNGSYFLWSSELYNPATGAWRATGNMKATRSNHTATLLSNGLVLVTGGRGHLSSCELYDPATGTWRDTGSMAVGRSNHTATLLKDGRVLVAGSDSVGVSRECEIYNPATGTWSSTGSLAQARSAHEATLLKDGRVLVTGGYAFKPNDPNVGRLPSCEIYNPATGTWSSTDDLLIARMDHTATLLNNGHVLVVGGYGPSGALTQCEVYDPAIGTWSGANSLSVQRYRHTATLLGNGQVLVVGGSGHPNSPVSSDLYDPATGIWRAGPKLAEGRYEHTATRLNDGKVLIAGGAGEGFLSSCALYDPATGNFQNSPQNPARAYHTATLLSDGQVLVTGGVGLSGLLSSCQVYNPQTGTWRPAGSLSMGRRGHTATLLPNGQVLVAGGFSSSGTLASCELYDPATGTWRAMGSMAAARSEHTATLLPNGLVLVAGGSNQGYVTPCELYDPATGLWRNTGSLATGRINHTQTLLANGQVLIAGGVNGGTLSNCELYDPATGLWRNTGSLVTDRREHTATLLKNGLVLVAGGFGGIGYLNHCELYNPATGLWRATASMKSPRLYHTATLLSNGQVLVTGGFNSASSEIYDIASGWNTTGSMANPRDHHTATLLSFGDVLVTGGRWGETPLATAELYGPAAPRLSLDNSIKGVKNSEGNNGTRNFIFTVTRRGDSSGTVRVNYATQSTSDPNGSHAIAGSDYVATNGTLVFAPGESSKSIAVAVMGDTLNEANETFHVALSAAQGASIIEAQAIGTIINDDRAPSLSIGDVTIAEGDTSDKHATFVITLSAASGQIVTVKATVFAGTAKAPGDYTNSEATLTFLSGETIKTFAVPVKGDLVDEADERFYVLLSAPVNASLGRGRGVGTIQDNDSEPGITIENLNIREGNSGQNTATFKVRLSAPSEKVVRFTAATENGSATAGSDYAALAATQIFFAPGTQETYVRVAIQGDLLDENNEFFTVNLSSPVNAFLADANAQGIILNDDTAPALIINDAQINEGNNGTQALTFTVTLSKPSGKSVAVNYATTNGTAHSGSDYAAQNGTLTFLPGSALTQTVSIVINGDTIVEDNELFYILLSGASNASIGRGRGVAAIVNDDRSQ